MSNCLPWLSHCFLSSCNICMSLCYKSPRTFAVALLTSQSNYIVSHIVLCAYPIMPCWCDLKDVAYLHVWWKHPMKQLGLNWLFAVVMKGNRPDRGEAGGGGVACGVRGWLAAARSTVAMTTEPVCIQEKSIHKAHQCKRQRGKDRQTESKKINWIILIVRLETHTTGWAVR